MTTGPAAPVGRSTRPELPARRRPVQAPPAGPSRVRPDDRRTEPARDARPGVRAQRPAPVAPPAAPLPPAPRPVATAPVLLRRELGDALRGLRQEQGRTLREVSGTARVSLGYLSEVERGQKEASSELLSSICGALGTPLSALLRQVSDRVALAEDLVVPDVVPADLVEDGRRPEGLVSAA